MSKKIFYFLFLFLFISPFSGSIFAQVDITDMFPKIGFNDFYTISEQRPWRYNNAILVDRNYYWDDIQQLGFTHMIGYAETRNFLAQPDLYIIDKRTQKNHTNLDSSSLVFRYSHGTGNYEGDEPFQLGGNTQAHHDSLYDNAGYGTTVQTAWWIEDYDGCIGDDINDPLHTGTHSRYATVFNDEAGYLY
jgi:hypothetical protein